MTSTTKEPARGASRDDQAQCRVTSSEASSLKNHERERGIEDAGGHPESIEFVARAEAEQATQRSGRLLAADLKAEFSCTLPKAGPETLFVGKTVFATLQRQAADWFQAEGVAEDARTLTQVGLMRYHGQGSEIAVLWTADPGGIESAFAEAHQSLHGFTLNAGADRCVHVADGWVEVPATIVPRWDRATASSGRPSSCSPTPRRS